MDSYLEELKAEAARVRGASPGKVFRIVICSAVPLRHLDLGQSDDREWNRCHG
jgi:hypothetical protein